MGDDNSDPLSEELDPLAESFKDKMRELENKLSDLSNIRRLAEDLDNVGMVKIEVNDYSRHQGMEGTQVRITGYVSSLSANGPRHERPLAERIVLLNPSQANIGYDEDAQAFRVMNTIVL